MLNLSRLRPVWILIFPLIMMLSAFHPQGLESLNILESSFAIGLRTPFVIPLLHDERKSDPVITPERGQVLLLRFLEKSLMDKDTPRALFMLRPSLAQMCHTFSKRLKNDLILNLRSILCPFNVWAQMAAAFWRDEIENGN